MNSTSLISIAVAFFIGVIGSNIYQKKFNPAFNPTRPAASQSAKGLNQTQQIQSQTVVKPSSDSKNSQQEASILAEAKLCQASLQDMTMKAAELESVVKGLITNQEERTKNWLNIKEAKLSNLAQAKKDLPTVESKLTALTETFEKRLEAIKNGYLKKCPCSAN